LSRHHRSQSASRLPVVIGRRTPLDGVPDKAVLLLGEDDRFDVLTDRRAPGQERPRPATAVDLRWARRETGKDAERT
jgi:hypothetical protein